MSPDKLQLDLVVVCNKSFFDRALLGAYLLCDTSSLLLYDALGAVLAGNYEQIDAA